MLRKMFEIRQVAVEFHKENKMVVKPSDAVTDHITTTSSGESLLKAVKYL